MSQITDIAKRTKKNEKFDKIVFGKKYSQNFARLNTCY